MFSGHIFLVIIIQLICNWLWNATSIFHLVETQFPDVNIVGKSEWKYEFMVRFLATHKKRAHKKRTWLFRDACMLLLMLFAPASISHVWSFSRSAWKGRHKKAWLLNKSIPLNALHERMKPAKFHFAPD